MKNLEEIKNSISEMEIQLAGLNAKVNELENNSEGGYHFTGDEMVKFVLKLQYEFVSQMERGIEEMYFGYDCVTLSVEGTTIDIEIDSNEIKRRVSEELEFDLDDDSIKVTVDSIYKSIKA